MANSADPDQRLLQKPTDLDLNSLQRQGISRFSRTRVKKYLMIILGKFSPVLHKSILWVLTCLEAPQWDISNKCPQSIRNKKIYPRTIIKYFSSGVLTSRKHAYIILTPLDPHFYIVKPGFTRVYIIFLISARKHRLWVLVRTASARQF